MTKADTISLLRLYWSTAPPATGAGPAHCITDTNKNTQMRANLENFILLIKGLCLEWTVVWCFPR